MNNNQGNRPMRVFSSRFRTRWYPNENRQTTENENTVNNYTDESAGAASSLCSTNQPKTTVSSSPRRTRRGRNEDQQTSIDKASSVVHKQKNQQTPTKNDVTVGVQSNQAPSKNKKIKVAQSKQTRIASNEGEVSQKSTTRNTVLQRNETLTKYNKSKVQNNQAPRTNYKGNYVQMSSQTLATSNKQMPTANHKDVDAQRNRTVTENNQIPKRKQNPKIGVKSSVRKVIELVAMKSIYFMDEEFPHLMPKQMPIPIANGPQRIKGSPHIPEWMCKQIKLNKPKQEQQTDEQKKKNNNVKSIVFVGAKQLHNKLQKLKYLTPDDPVEKNNRNRANKSACGAHEGFKCQQRSYKTLCRQKYIKLHRVKPVKRWFQCDQCPELCKSSKRLEKHMSCHSDLPLKKLVRSSNGSSKCYFQDDRKIFLEKHVHSAHSFHCNADLFICIKCDFQCVRKNRLLNHIRRFHPHPMKYFKCLKCPAQCRSPINLSKHIYRKHRDDEVGPRPKHITIRCKFCQYRCENPTTLARHYHKIHNGYRYYFPLFKCHICNSIVQTVYKLQSHIIMKHCSPSTHDQSPHIDLPEELPIQYTYVRGVGRCCEHCGFLRFPDDLRCHECSYTAKCESDLTAHISSEHYRDVKGSLQCEHCDYTCVKQKLIQRHYRTKHGTHWVYKNECEICDFITNEPAELKKHIAETNHIPMKYRGIPCSRCDPGMGPNTRSEIKHSSAAADKLI